MESGWSAEGLRLHRSDEPQSRAARWPIDERLRIAGELEMRSAVTRPGLARMAAKGDRIAIPVTAIGIVAIAGFELVEGQQPRADADTAKPNRRFGRGRCRNQPISSIRAAPASAGGRGDRAGFGTPSRLLRSGHDETHPLAAAERRIPGIRRSKLRIERARDFRIGLAPGMKLTQHF